MMHTEHAAQRHPFQAARRVMEVLRQTYPRSCGIAPLSSVYDLRRQWPPAPKASDRTSRANKCDRKPSSSHRLRSTQRLAALGGAIASASFVFWWVVGAADNRLSAAVVALITAVPILIVLRSSLDQCDRKHQK
jgi:hypothetical protein